MIVQRKHVACLSRARPPFDEVLSSLVRDVGKRARSLGCPAVVLGCAVVALCYIPVVGAHLFGRREATLHLDPSAPRSALVEIGSRLGRFRPCPDREGLSTRARPMMTNRADRSLQALQRAEKSSSIFDRALPAVVCQVLVAFPGGVGGTTGASTDFRDWTDLRVHVDHPLLLLGRAGSAPPCPLGRTRAMLPGMQPAGRKCWTVAEYLTMDRAAETKHQFLRGEIFAMAGASREHNLLVSHLLRALGNALEERGCEVYPSDMRVAVHDGELYTYPDISITCDKPRFLDGERDTLLNPHVIFEVLSDSTETYDRGKKFEIYRTIATLADYVLVSQKEPLVEHFTRQPDGSWNLRERRLGDRIELCAVACVIAVEGVYRSVLPPPRV